MDRPISLEARRVDLDTEPPFLLGDARIDPVAHEITIAGRSQRMQPQTMKVLVALHDKSGKVVTRNELVDRCWDGRVVGDDVINRCISLLRRFAAGKGGFRIETVPRGGYRLLEIEHRASPKPGWIVAAACSVGLLVAALIISVWMSRAPVGQGAPRAPAVTVVPFTVDSNDPTELQVAQAAPISISHMLSESGFPIILGTSRNTGESTSDYVISGNVRRDGGSLAVTVQMNGARSGTMIFSHDFESSRDRSQNLPDQIGATLAAELAWTGAEMVLDRRHPIDPQIASELMKAISLTIEQGDSLRSYQIMRHVAPLAPNSAIAQLSLAIDTGFSIGSIPREQRAEALAIGRRAADRARQLAPEFGDVYITWCLLHSPVRMVECEARLRQASSIDPSSSFVPGYLSTLSYDSGRFDEAVALARVSLANDPYKPAKMARMVRMLEATGGSDEAEQIFEEATRLWPGGQRMAGSRLVGLAEGANYEGIARLVGARGAAPDATLAALMGARQRHDLPAVARTCDPKEPDPFQLAVCMTILADLGDLDRSFEIAAKLYPSQRAATAADEDRLWLYRPELFSTAILTGPAGRSMRADPRFLALADRVGLLDYWRSGRLPDFCTERQEPVCAKITRKRP